MIPANTHNQTGLNVASLGSMSAEDVSLEALQHKEMGTVAEMIRRGIGTYEEAGTVVASTFRRLDNFSSIYEAPGACFIVAKEHKADGQLYGGAGIGPLHGLSPSEGLGEIRDLVVAEHWRGQGIGARLLKRCLDEAKRLGYQRLYLETTPQMEQARKLFIRFGFRPVTTGMPKIGQGDSMPCYYILESLT